MSTATQPQPAVAKVVLQPIDLSALPTGRRHVADQIPAQLEERDVFQLPPFRITDVMKRRGLAKTAQISLQLGDSRSMDIGFKVYTEKSFRNDKTYYSRGVVGWAETQEFILLLRRHDFPLEQLEDVAASSKEFVMVNTSGPLNENTPLFAVVSDIPMDLLVFPAQANAVLPEVQVLGTSVVREGEVAIHGLGESADALPGETAEHPQHHQQQQQQQQLPPPPPPQPSSPLALRRPSRHAKLVVPSLSLSARRHRDSAAVSHRRETPSRKRSREENGYTASERALIAGDRSRHQPKSKRLKTLGPAGRLPQLPMTPEEIGSGGTSFALPAAPFLADYSTSFPSLTYAQQAATARMSSTYPLHDRFKLVAASAVDDDGSSVHSWDDGTSDSEYEEPYMGYDSDRDSGDEQPVLDVDPLLRVYPPEHRLDPLQGGGERHLPVPQSRPILHSQPRPQLQPQPLLPPPFYPHHQHQLQHQQQQQPLYPSQHPQYLPYSPWSGNNNGARPFSPYVSQCVPFAFDLRPQMSGSQYSLNDLHRLKSPAAAAAAVFLSRNASFEPEALMEPQRPPVPSFNSHRPVG